MINNNGDERIFRMTKTTSIHGWHNKDCIYIYRKMRVIRVMPFSILTHYFTIVKKEINK